MLFSTLNYISIPFPCSVQFILQYFSWNSANSTTHLNFIFSSFHPFWICKNPSSSVHKYVPKRLSNFDHMLPLKYTSWFHDKWVMVSTIDDWLWLVEKKGLPIGHALGIWICGCSLFYRRELWASKFVSFNSTKSLKIFGCKRWSPKDLRVSAGTATVLTHSLGPSITCQLLE